jgi:hypothetical protein
MSNQIAALMRSKTEMTLEDATKQVTNSPMFKDSPTTQPAQSGAETQAAPHQPATRADLPPGFAQTLRSKGLSLRDDGTVIDQNGQTMVIVKDSAGRLKAIGANAGQ